MHKVKKKNICNHKSRFKQNIILWSQLEKLYVEYVKNALKILLKII